MKILLLSSEVHPFSKTGGLADMVGALGKYVAMAGDEVAILTPLYASVRQKQKGLALEEFPIHLTLGNRTVSARLWSLKAADRLTVYFLDQPEFFDRAELYGERGSVGYPDNDQRFIYYAKAAVYLARWFHWKPDVVHAHDWQAGLAPLFIQDQKLRDHWTTAPKTCLTIHNLASQGNFPWSSYHLTNLPPEYFSPQGLEFWGNMNCLKAGIVYSDFITTVSPRYAREITTEAFGCGLDGALRNRASRLEGILNGVDYEEWRTEKNPFLPEDYDAASLTGKIAAKLAVQREMGLPERANVPLFGTVSRLVEQKGSDLQLAALEEMLGSDMQFILLGSGDPKFEAGFRQLAIRHPSKVAVKIGYDAALAHQIEAGSDFFLMPSRFEPCGLNQMYSLRYGTIPIVRSTGGLDDSVCDAREDLIEADGIKFSEPSPRALAKAMRKALAVHQHPDLLNHFRRNGMTKDFSWTITAQAYCDVYRRVAALD